MLKTQFHIYSSMAFPNLHKSVGQRHLNSSLRVGIFRRRYSYVRTLESDLENRSNCKMSSIDYTSNDVIMIIITLSHFPVLSSLPVDYHLQYSITIHHNTQLHTVQHYHLRDGL